MDAQPPQDLSALVRAIEELTTQIAQMKAELSEIKQVCSFDKNNYQSYYEKADIQSQEQNGERMQLEQRQEQYQRRDKHNPPLVPEGEELTCVRCDYKWIPRVRRPQLCPGCKTPWWFPPRWKWHQIQTQ